MCCVLSKYKRIKKLSTSLTNEFQISGIVKMTLSSRVTPANVNCMYRKYELLTTEEHAMADRCHDIYALARSDITWRQRRATEYWLKFKHRNTDQTPKYNVWLLNLVQYAIAILLYQTTVIIEDGSIIAASVFLARNVIYTSRAYATVSVCLSVTEVHWVAVHAGNTAAAPASEVEAIIRSQTWPPPMEGSSRAMLATARPSCKLGGAIHWESYLKRRLNSLIRKSDQIGWTNCRA